MTSSGSICFGFFLSLFAASTASAGQVSFAGSGHAETPVWSHDGAHIAFEVNSLSGKVELYMAAFSGSMSQGAKKVNLPGGANPFASGSSVMMNAAWHPEGLVIFEGSNPGGQIRLYYVETTTTQASEMIETTKLAGDLTFPSVSQDGNSLLFVSDATGNGDIRSRETMGSTLSQITSSPESELFPAFSKDGKTVVYTRKRNNTGDIFKIPFGGGESELVAGGAGDQTRPVFAKDGRIVFFDGARGENVWDLASIGASGERVNIARGIRLPTRSRPAISHDGEWVAYTFDDPTKAGKVMLSRVDGSDTRSVDTSFEACGEPAFGYQSGKVLLAFTALPDKGSDWRFLYVEDVTDKL